MKNLPRHSPSDFSRKRWSAKIVAKRIEVRKWTIFLWKVASEPITTVFSWKIRSHDEHSVSKIRVFHQISQESFKNNWKVSKHGRCSILEIVIFVDRFFIWGFPWVPPAYLASSRPKKNVKTKKKIDYQAQILETGTGNPYVARGSRLSSLRSPRRPLF